MADQHPNLSVTPVPSDKQPGSGTDARSGGTGSSEPASQPSFYELVGGSATFTKLVDEFYAGVANDPILRPMYPEEDLGPAAERLRLFLEQYWGGPRTYSERRGHPRLRMRHAPFVIGPRERDAWLAHMHRAVKSLNLPEELEAPLWDYLVRAAHFMVNSLE